jgi:hypothetical protein
MPPRRSAPILLACLGLVSFAAPAAQAAGASGAWSIREGVRLFDVSFSSTTKDGRLRPDLLVLGRATGAPRTLVLSVAVCRTGSPTCRTEASRRVRFVRRPRTLIGWTVPLRSASKITRVRYRLARAGAKAAGGTMTLSLPATAWTVKGFLPGLFVRESKTVFVDAVSFRADPLAGGGAAVAAKATVRTPSAFDVEAGVGACGDFVGCPLPGADRTFSMIPGAANDLSMTATLPAPPAGTSRVRFRGDGGVTPSPFLSFLLPWPT